MLPRNLYHFILYFLRPYKIIILVFIFTSFIAGFWGPFNSILIKEIINKLNEVENRDTAILILPASFLVLNFVIFDLVTWRALTYIRAKFVPVIINNIISQTMSYALRQSHKFFLNNLSGKITKQITNLAEGIEKIITSVSANFLRGASLLLTSFIAAYFVNPIFCFILIIWFLVFTAASITMSKKLVFLSDLQATAESSVVGEIVDTISNHSNVRLFSRRNFEYFRMIPFLNSQQQAYYNTYFYTIIMHSIQGGLIALMMSFLAYYLVHLYSKNLVTIGDFALIFGLAMETGHMMWFTMSEVDELNKAVGKCRQSLQAIITPIEITDQKDAKILKCSNGAIAFRNVTFNYKGPDPLFQNLSQFIHGGQKIGLVGYSGSGKTTFINLLLRFYDITGGSILIDGQDIRDITQDSLRNAISMIPQDPVLFQRTIMENIRYGNVNANDEDVIEAAKSAHAHEFISKLPYGYESEVGERGIKLSGGQRQRIAIARAILEDAPIIILDEATSQLDSVTESLIQRAFIDLIKNKTTIVIAHRMSTILNMDRILVFDKGKIVEDGNHGELLKQNGLYKQLWNTQIGGFLGIKK